MEPPPLPLDLRAIERILPHRRPFLLVDRVTELEPDRRIVGIKHVAADERYLVKTSRGAVLPPMILMEAVAQVGAILVLGKPENRLKLAFFMGIEKARFRRPARAGDVVVIEAVVRRLGSRMGVFDATAAVEGVTVAEGAMTFALGEAPALTR